MKKFLVLLPLLLMVGFVFAQAGEYTFVQSTTAYTEITGGTVVATGAQDDVQYPLTPPFDFSFNYTPVTAMAMSTNGYLSFNAATNSFSYAAISSSAVGTGVAAVISRDLKGRTDGELRFEVFGTAPNRYAVYQWKNWTAYGSSYTNDNWNFQIVLYETPNNIVYNYGPFTFTSTYSNTAQVGLRGTTNADFKNRTTTTDWTATTQGLANNASCAISSTIYPPNGLQFQFNYPVATTVPNPAILLFPTSGGWAFTDVTLSWLSGGGLPDGYDVYLDTVDPPVALVSNNQTATSYTPLGLVPGTTYYWQIVPRNSFGPAVGCPVWSFKTPTPTQMATSFETDFPPVGWTNPGTWTRSSSYKYHGTYSAYKAGSTTTQYVLSGPKCTITPTSTIDFWSCASSTTAQLQVVYSPDRVTWTQVGATITHPVTYTLYHQIVDLSTLAGNNYYLGFANGPATGSNYVDYVFGPEITPEVPGTVTLVTPADLAVDQSNYPTFSWTAATTGGVPAGYRVYCDTNNPPTTQIADVTTLSCTATAPLNWGGVYYWTVVAYNGAGLSTAPTPFRFTVMADPTITVFDHLEGFDGTVFPPLGWTNLKIAGTSLGLWDRATSGTSPTCSPVAGAGMARFNSYSYYAGTIGILATPPINFGTNNYFVDFWMYRDTGYPSYIGEQVNVHYNTAPNLIGATLLGTINRSTILEPVVTDPGWYAYSFPLPVAGKSIGYVIFEGVSQYGNNMFIDEVLVRDEPPTVPVELSSFTATLTAQNYVQLSWVSQTESQMMGYLVYRNTTDNQSTSVLIDQPMIPATNTSSTQTYTTTDKDVEIGTTYFYWLEAVDYNSSSYHGPVSVTVEGEVPPVMPEITSMRNSYPNPFRAGTSAIIEVGLKAGETGTVTIYNVHGQTVRSFAVSEGFHTLNWDGRDANGKACASGIYFYRLTTPSVNQTRKLVMAK